MPVGTAVATSVAASTRHETARASTPPAQRVVMFTDSVGLGAEFALPRAFPADWQVRVVGRPAEMVGEMEQNFVRPRLASNPEWFGDHVVIAAGYNFPHWDHGRFVREVDSMVEHVDRGRREARLLDDVPRDQTAVHLGSRLASDPAVLLVLPRRQPTARAGARTPPEPASRRLEGGRRPPRHHVRRDPPEQRGRRTVQQHHPGDDRRRRHIGAGRIDDADQRARRERCRRRGRQRHHHRPSYRRFRHAAPVRRTATGRLDAQPSTRRGGGTRRRRRARRQRRLLRDDQGRDQSDRRRHGPVPPRRRVHRTAADTMARHTIGERTDARPGRRHRRSRLRRCPATASATPAIRRRSWSW